MYLIVILFLLISYEMLGQMSHSWTMAMGMFSTIYLLVEYIHVTFIFVQTIQEHQRKKYLTLLLHWNFAFGAL